MNSKILSIIILVTIAIVAIVLVYTYMQNLAVLEDSINQAYGQGDSMVDKLIEDTKRGQQIGQSYRAELINRIENSTCLNYPRFNYSSEDEKTPKEMQEEEENYKELDKELRANWDSMVNNMEISQIEQVLKSCVAEGKIK